MTRSGGVRGRALGTFVDQGICSLSNFVVVLVSVHFLSLRSLGSFALAYSFATLILVSVRSLILEDLVINFATAPSEDRKHAARSAAGAATVIGVLGAEMCCAVVLIGAPAASPTLLAMGSVLPALLLQDAWRYYFFAAGTPFRAAGNDGACLAATVLILFLEHHVGAHSPPAMLVAWGAGTGLGAVVGCFQVGVVPDLVRPVHWLRRQRTVGVPLAAGTAITQAAGRVSLVIIGVVCGIGSVGILSAAQTVLSPVNTLATASLPFVVPEAARRLQAGVSVLRRFTLGVGVVLAVSSGLLCTVCLLLPSRAIAVYAGPNGAIARPLLLPVAVWIVGTAFGVAPAAGLRVNGRSRALLRLSLWSSVLLVLGTAVGCGAGGVAAAAWSMAVCSLVSSAIWWRAHDRRPRSEPLAQIPGESWLQAVRRSAADPVSGRVQQFPVDQDQAGLR